MTILSATTLIIDSDLTRRSLAHRILPANDAPRRSLSSAHLHSVDTGAAQTSTRAPTSSEPSCAHIPSCASRPVPSCSPFSAHISIHGAKRHCDAVCLHSLEPGIVPPRFEEEFDCESLPDVHESPVATVTHQAMEVYVCLVAPSLPRQLRSAAAPATLTSTDRRNTRMMRPTRIHPGDHRCPASQTERASCAK